MNVPGLIFIVTLCCLDGLVIFAVYSGCDLKASGKITSNDQVKISVIHQQVVKWHKFGLLFND